MITFLLLWAVLFVSVLGWATVRGHSLLIARSRVLRDRLSAPGRSLLPVERQALTRHFHLAFPADAPVYPQTGEIRLVGWRTPQFLLDELLIGLPEPLHGCVNYGFDNAVELIANPHAGAPHALVIRLNGVSLVCDCQAQAAGIALPPPRGAVPHPLLPRTEYFPAPGSVEIRR